MRRAVRHQPPRRRLADVRMQPQVIKRPAVHPHHFGPKTRRYKGVLPQAVHQIRRVAQVPYFRNLRLTHKSAQLVALLDDPVSPPVPDAPNLHQLRRIGRIQIERLQVARLARELRRQFVRLRKLPVRPKCRPLAPARHLVRQLHKRGQPLVHRRLQPVHFLDLTFGLEGPRHLAVLHHPRRHEVRHTPRLPPCRIQRIRVESRQRHLRHRRVLTAPPAITTLFRVARGKLAVAAPQPVLVELRHQGIQIASVLGRVVPLRRIKKRPQRQRHQQHPHQQQHQHHRPPRLAFGVVHVRAPAPHHPRILPIPPFSLRHPRPRCAPVILCHTIKGVKVTQVVNPRSPPEPQCLQANN